jgi:type II secretory pathway pseudopilin PulG
MKSVKCFECGFVGWADAEHCKKCGVGLVPESRGDSYQTQPSYGDYQSSYRGNSHQELKNGLAIFALVIGIVNLFTLGLLGVGAIAGIIVAVVAQNRIKRNPHVYGGKGLATAGLIISILSVVIVVPLGIVAAIAIPNLLASRRAANEGATLATLRKLDDAEFTYQATHASGQYGTLDQLAADQLISPELAAGHRYGYKFTIEITEDGTAGISPRFQIVAVPLTYGSSGRRSFYLDETGIIRGEDNRGAEASELTPPLNADGYSSSSPPSPRYDTSDE